MIGLRRQFIAIASQLFRRRGAQSALGYVRESSRMLNEALLAQQHKRWPDAVMLWRDYLALVPSDIRGHVNLGNALLALDRVEEAASCAQTLRARWPQRAEGAVLGARVTARGAPRERIEVWRPVAVKFPTSVAAQEELGRALIDAGQSQDIRVIESHLEALDRRAAARLRGHMLSAAGNDGQTHSFWQAAAREFADDPDFLRKAIDAGLRAGAREAAADFDALLAAGHARLSDANFAIGLANLLRAGGDRPRAVRLVRRYLKSLASPADTRLAALKLSRVLFREFPRRAVQADTAPSRFTTMVRRAPMSPAARDWWQQTDALYDRIRIAAPDCLLESDISRQQCEAFVAEVRRKLLTGAPFCFIRLGDAESNALHYEPQLAQHFERDVRERERSWWARELADDERDALNRDVNAAIWAADALGIPCCGRILRDMDLKSERIFDTGRTGRGHRAVLNAVRERLASGVRAPRFVSANLHQDLHRFGLYPSLLAGAREAICVSSHEALPERLVRGFGVVSASNITLRSAHSLRHKVEQRQDAYALPDQRQAVMEAMDGQLNGRLVIVAAGYVGKWICHQAAQRGAVALDLGSIADYWMGARTRGYLELV
ncbi:MAG TPA: hypothetical protein VGG36_02975 [Rhizomicrobium sp.]